MATNVTIPEGFRLVSNTPAIPEGFSLVSGVPVVSPEIAAEVKANNEAYAKRQEENRPWLDKNPIGRLGVAAVQGVANASLNPAGYVARAFGMDTKPFEPQTVGERVAELGGQYGYDTAVLMALLKGYAPEYVSGTGLTGNVVREMAKGGTPTGLRAALGSAILTGTVNPENPYARMATDFLGAGVAMAGSAPKSSISKANQKSLKVLKKNIEADELNQAMQDAQRTGRSVLEVGGEGVVQAGQRARQQSPKARNILSDELRKIADTQQQRTREVINEQLGSRGRVGTVDEVIANAKSEAAPFYDRLKGRELAENVLTPEEQAQQNFNRWFEGSKVVDENGKPLAVYHGTNAEFDTFIPSEDGALGKGIYTAESKDYAKGVGQNVKAVYVKLKNPYYAEYPFGEDAAKVTEKLKSQGYDGVYHKGNGFVVAFEPNQVKSVNNSGAWSSSPSLTDAGWTPKPASPLKKFIEETPHIQEEIGRVRKDTTFPLNERMANDTNFDILNNVVKNLDDEISTATRYEQTEKAARLIGIKNDLLNQMDAAAPEYKTARDIYSNAYKFRDASTVGKDVFNNRLSVEEFGKKVADMGNGERTALSIGLRDELVNKLGSVENEVVANKKFLPQNVRDKMKLAIGEDQANKIIEEAEQTVKFMRNKNSVLGGSDTADKLTLKGAVKGLKRVLKKPWDTAVDTVFYPFDGNENVRLAEALTNRELPSIYNQARRASLLRDAISPTRRAIGQTLYRDMIENN